MNDRTKDILKRAGYRAEQPMGGTLGKCVEKVKEFYIQRTMEDGLTREEAAREVEEGIDWGMVKRDLESGVYGMTPLEHDPRARTALEIVREKAPELHEKLLGRTFILSSAFHSLHATTAPMRVDGRKVAIIVPESYLDMPPEAIASRLAHEALHLDLDENPEKYGFDKTRYFVEKMMGLLDDSVWDRLEALGLDARYEPDVSKARERSWRVARYKIWPEDAVFRITACWKGRESKPRWE